MLNTVRPAFTNFGKNTRIKQVPFLSKFKVIRMVVGSFGIDLTIFIEKKN